MKKRFSFLGLFALLAIIPAFPQPLRFTQESIRIDVRMDSYSLDGLYVFENQGPAEIQRSLFYPFSETEIPPESVSVVNADADRIVPFTRTPKGLSFVLSVPGYTTSTLKVSFHQRTSGHRLAYILRSTAMWGRPLDRAMYTVRIPVSCTLSDLSLSPNRIRRDLEGTTYTMVRENFLPQHDLVVTWRRSAP